MRLKHGEDEIFLSKDTASPGPAPVAAAPAAPEVDRTGRVEIKAPNLGTFCRKPSPDADPYVTEETEICPVEVMKLFITIRAGMCGTVREIVAEVARWSNSAPH